MATEQRAMLAATFRDRLKARNAFTWLQEHGYEPHEIHLLMSDKTRAQFVQHGDEITAGNAAVEGVGVGGAVGTIVGATIAAILATGTALVIPPLGLVIAGPLAAALAGGGAGAVTGGVLGALIGLGVPESNAKAYEQALRDGGVVVGVVPHSTEDGSMISDYFENLEADNVCYC